MLLFLYIYCYLLENELFFCQIGWVSFKVGQCYYDLVCMLSLCFYMYVNFCLYFYLFLFFNFFVINFDLQKNIFLYMYIDIFLDK